MAEKPVNTGAVADFLGVKEATVAVWRRKRTGPPFIRVGNRCLYFLSDVEAWLREEQRKTRDELGLPQPDDSEPIPAPKAKSKTRGFGGW